MLKVVTDFHSKSPPKFGENSASPLAELGGEVTVDGYDGVNAVF